MASATPRWPFSCPCLICATWTRNCLLGAVIFTASLMMMMLWIPSDVDSGLIEKVRRRYRIGDMLGPVVATAIILIGAGWLCLSRERDAPRSILPPLRAIAMIVGITGSCMLLMRWTGPALVGLADMVGIVNGEAGYRPLRDTLPWKFTGFVIGGGVLIWLLSCHADGKWSWRRLGIGMAIALVMALFFDLPFDDLVLPPNGDL